MFRRSFTRFFAAAATVAAVGCSSGFTEQERELIMSGEEDLMHVTSIADEQDLLVLRSISEPLTQDMVQSKEFKRLCQRMLATVQNPEHEGVGIAAPQVGVLRRVVAVQRFDKEGEPFEFFVNPEIVEFGEEQALGGEGCLSVPEISGQVMRAQSLVLRYRDVDFVERTEHIEGFTAVIFQHEIDHLDGVLFIDKMLSVEEEAEVEYEVEQE